MEGSELPDRDSILIVVSAIFGSVRNPMLLIPSLFKNTLTTPFKSNKCLHKMAIATLPPRMEGR